MKIIVTTESAEATESFSRQLGGRVRGGETFQMVSDLGGGKTTFVRGFASGMGSSDAVSSPTFTISQLYETPKGTLYHYDFYRLLEPGLMREELKEGLADENGVVIIEWSQLVEELLPDDTCIVTIDKSSDDESKRIITFEFDERLEYLFEGIE